MKGKQTFYCPHCGGEIEEEEVAGLMMHKAKGGHKTNVD